MRTETRARAAALMDGGAETTLAQGCSNASSARVERSGHSQAWARSGRTRETGPSDSGNAVAGGRDRPEGRLERRQWIRRTGRSHHPPRRGRAQQRGIEAGDRTRSCGTATGRGNLVVLRAFLVELDGIVIGAEGAPS